MKWVHSFECAWIDVLDELDNLNVRVCTPKHQEIFLCHLPILVFRETGVRQHCHSPPRARQTNLQSYFSDNRRSRLANPGGPHPFSLDLASTPTNQLSILFCVLHLSPEDAFYFLWEKVIAGLTLDLHHHSLE